MNKKEQMKREIETMIKIDGKIQKMIIKDTAKPTGNSSYISLPKELIGKNLKLKIEVLN